MVVRQPGFFVPEGQEEAMALPKMKTHRGAAKRIKVTGGGSYARRRAYKSHKLEKKSSCRRRRLRQVTTVSPADAGRLKRLLPYG